MGFLVVALGLMVLFNFIILRVKWNRGDYADVVVDASMLILLNSVFGGSILGVISATAGSTLISLYLMWKPVKLFEDINEPVSKGTTVQSDLDIALDQMQQRIDKLLNKEKGK